MKFLLERIPRSRETRQARTALLFVFAFAMSGAYVCCRSLADALFLSRVGPTRLPAMILVAAASVASLTAVYAALIRRRRLNRIVCTIHVLFAAATTLLALSAGSSQNAVHLLAPLYVLAELRGTLGSIHFATLLNEMFRRKAPTRISGVAGFGSTVAGIVFGAVTGWVAGAFGAQVLVYVIVCLDVVAAHVALRCSPQPASLADVRPLPKSNLSLFKELPLTRFLAVVIVLKTLIVVLVEFQWKTAAVGRYHAEDELAAFFGAFYAVLFLMTGGIQLLGTGRLLTRFGATPGLAVLPAALILCFSTAFFVTGQQAMFWRMTVARGCDSLRRSLTDPATQILYWPLEPNRRRQVIAMMGGWIKPLTEAAAAISLIVVSGTNSRFDLTPSIVVLALVWLVWSWQGRRFEPVQKPSDVTMDPGPV